MIKTMNIGTVIRGEQVLCLARHPRCFLLLIVFPLAWLLFQEL
jgi:hypothetical protein